MFQLLSTCPMNCAQSVFFWGPQDLNVEPSVMVLSIDAEELRTLCRVTITHVSKAASCLNKVMRSQSAYKGCSCQYGERKNRGDTLS